MAVRVKPAALIIKMHGAKNNLAAGENLTDEELERLHQSYGAQAEATMSKPEERLASRAQKVAS
jgi:hypothetical protein